MKYVATIKWCAQVGPEDFQMITRHMEAKPETTIAELIAWMKRFERGGLTEFVVCEVDDPDKKV